jgi:hypothetical protein
MIDTIISIAGAVFVFYAIGRVLTFMERIEQSAEQLARELASVSGSLWRLAPDPRIQRIVKKLMQEQESKGEPQG